MSLWFVPLTFQIFLLSSLLGNGLFISKCGLYSKHSAPASNLKVQPLLLCLAPQNTETSIYRAWLYNVVRLNETTFDSSELCLISPLQCCPLPRNQSLCCTAPFASTSSWGREARTLYYIPGVVGVRMCKYLAVNKCLLLFLDSSSSYLDFIQMFF